MQTLTKGRLKRLDDNAFCVHYIGKRFAFVRKWSKWNSKKGWIPLYVLVKVKEDAE